MGPRKCEIPGAPAGPACTIFHEGEALEAKQGEPLMVTLLAHGIETASRSIKYHRPRGAFCLAGSCGQCWMRIDDLPNRPACQTTAIEGRSIGRQNAFPSADVDLFRAADLFFSGGFDHHRLATTPLSPLNSVMQGTARQMAGLGNLSEQRPEHGPPIEELAIDVVIVGAGPAGMAAALEAHGLGHRVILLEARSTIGGQLRSGLFADLPELAELPRRTRSALGERIWCRSTAVGLYEDQRGPQLLVKKHADDGDRLVILRPQTLILANGGYEQTPLFGNNDLPGHYGARAAAELILVHGVLPGSPVIIGDGGSEIAARLERALGDRKVPCKRIDLAATPILTAKGRNRVKGVELVGKRGAIEGQMLASAAPPSPAYELAQQGGADLRYQPGLGFVVEASADGSTRVSWLKIAGELGGASTAIEAKTSGDRAAAALGKAKP